MSDVRPRSTNIPKGLETTRDTRSSRLSWTNYLNARVERDADVRRKGMVRLYRFTAPSVLMDFDGTNDLVTLSTDSRWNPLGVRFTLEMLMQNDSIAADAFFIGRPSATTIGLTVKQTTTSTVVTTILDSASNSTTITHTGLGADTKMRYQLKRDGASVTVTINGTEQTGTMNATNLLKSGGFILGADNGGSFLNGRIDFLRVLKYVKSDTNDGECRLVNPRTPSVLVDYVIEPDANGYVLDRGPLGIHGKTTGSPATNVAPLALNPAPVLGIASNLSTSSATQAYARVAGAIYPFTVK